MTWKGSRWARLGIALALGVAMPAGVQADERALGEELDAPQGAADPADELRRPERALSPYVQLTAGGGVQEDTRHDVPHGSVRTQVIAGLSFPFGLRVGASATMITFYDSAQISFTEGDSEHSSSRTSAAGTYFGGLEIAFRPRWDPLALHVGAHGGVGVGEITVVDEARLDVVEEPRVAFRLGGHVAIGVAVFDNLDLLFRIDAEQVVIGERDGFHLGLSLGVELH